MIHILLVVIYLAFISLGLPDSLLGAAWPSMYPELGVSVSYAGSISMIIALGTIISSLQSDRLTRKFGTGVVTMASVATTAVALIGISCVHTYPMLCLWAIPYGLGAGSVDASLNNYVALHYSSRHMSWLHCMWGVGASLGPYLMGMILTGGGNWNSGYRLIGVIQVVLTAILLISLPLWKRRSSDGENNIVTLPEEKSLSLKEIIRISGAKEVMISFFCYCAIEQTVILWGASFLTLSRGLSAQTAAGFGALFCLGITIGRAISGFVTMKLSDNAMVRLGQGLVGFGILLLFIPGSIWFSYLGLGLIGLGCAPIYPSIIHATPARFGAERSQAIIGVEMASAYVGTCLMPPIFGLIAQKVSPSLLPVYLLGLLAIMVWMFGKLTAKTTD